MYICLQWQLSNWINFLSRLFCANLANVASPPDAADFFCVRCLLRMLRSCIYIDCAMQTVARRLWTMEVGANVGWILFFAGRGGSFISISVTNLWSVPDRRSVICPDVGVISQSCRLISALDSCLWPMMIFFHSPICKHSCWTQVHYSLDTKSTSTPSE